MRILILGLTFANVLYAKTLPVVQPGLFVISGVATCGNGNGYCLMGSDCTVNEDFQPDANGHCDGLRTAFLPETHFSCCLYATADNSTFDELNASLPPTSTLDEQINETVTSKPDLFNEAATDSSWVQSVFETNDDASEQTRIQDEVDANRMSRIGVDDERDEGHAQSDTTTLSALPDHPDRRPNSEVAADATRSNENVSDSARLVAHSDGTFDVRGVYIADASSSNDEHLRQPGTALISVNGRETADEFDSVDAIRRFDEANASGDGETPARIVDTSDDTTRESDSSEEDCENDEYGASRQRDLGQISNHEADTKIDINHLGCANDVHTDSDLPVLLEQQVAENTASLGKVQTRLGRLTEYPRDIDDHSHLRSPIQWFQVARSIVADMEAESPNSTDGPQMLAELRSMDAGAAIAYLPTLTLPEEFRGYSAAPKEKFPKDECVNLPGVDDGVPRCVNVWKFIANDAIVCFGTLISSIWLLTSASCITKIYDNGMDAVVVTDVEEKNGLYGISNMIVNENYKTEEQHEVNDIGLVSLDRISNSSCIVCLSNQEKKYANKTCLTYILTTNRNNEDALNKCQGRIKALNMHSKLYLSLQCPVDESLKPKTHNSSGNALWCENVLNGIETTYNHGLIVFTPVYEHAGWISQNIELYL